VFGRGVETKLYIFMLVQIVLATPQVLSIGRDHVLQ
jgi:hypothetical protein